MVIIVKSVTIASGTRAAVLFQSIQYETQDTPTSIEEGIYSCSKKKLKTRFKVSLTLRHEYEPLNIKKLLTSQTTHVFVTLSQESFVTRVISKFGRAPFAVRAN